MANNLLAVFGLWIGSSLLFGALLSVFFSEWRRARYKRVFREREELRRALHLPPDDEGTP